MYLAKIVHRLKTKTMCLLDSLQEKWSLFKTVFSLIQFLTH